MHIFPKVAKIILIVTLLLPAITTQGSGLDFPGSGAVSTTMRFRFLDPLAIYPATYIWKAYPRRQKYYFTTFFWGNDDGQDNLSTFHWDNGKANTFYGPHPYPIYPDYNSHKWEIATDYAQDFLSTEDVVFDRWYEQALVTWADSTGKHTYFYWDLPDTSKVVKHTASVDYGNKAPPVPALTFGDAPWSPGPLEARYITVFSRGFVFMKPTLPSTKFCRRPLLLCRQPRV